MVIRTQYLSLLPNTGLESAVEHLILNHVYISQSGTHSAEPECAFEHRKEQRYIWHTIIF